MLNMQIILIGIGIILILGFIYLFRRQLLAYALQHGSRLIQRLALQVVLAVSGSDELPRWVLIKEQGSRRASLGLLTQAGSNISTIFIPSGPRLFPGELQFITNEHWRALDITFEEGLKLLLTLGLLPETQSLSRTIWNRMEEF